MIWRIALCALVACFVGAILGESGFRARRVVSVACIVVIFSAITAGIGEIIESAIPLVSMAGIGDLATSALKVVGVGYLFGFVSDVAEEVGERGIAGTVTIVGRVEMLLLVLPYFKRIINLSIELLK